GGNRVDVEDAAGAWAGIGRDALSERSFEISAQGIEADPHLHAVATFGPSAAAEAIHHGWGEAAAHGGEIAAFGGKQSENSRLSQLRRRPIPAQPAGIHLARAHRVAASVHEIEMRPWPQALVEHELDLGELQAGVAAVVEILELEALQEVGRL